MRPRPTPDPHCSHCKGSGWIYEDVWVVDGWSVSGDECFCIKDKWSDMIDAEVIKQIMEASDEDVLSGNYPPLVKSVTEEG